jgi:SAM-dependent methyltransferase
VGFLGAVFERASSRPALLLFYRRFLDPDRRALRELIRRTLRVGERVRTLEVGCGPGLFSDLFEGEDYVGADLNSRHIDYARRRRKGTFVVTDARKADLPDGRFDQILVFGLLHHLPRDDARSVLSEARRVLSPGGSILTIERVAAVLGLSLAGRLIRRGENAEHVRSQEEYRSLYATVGRIEREEMLASGAGPYYAAVIRVS